jgi:hypothetical protein
MGGIVFLILGFLAFPLNAFAGFRPSFMLDSCVWETTHIMIVNDYSR